MIYGNLPQSREVLAHPGIPSKLCRLILIRLWGRSNRGKERLTLTLNVPHNETRLKIDLGLVKQLAGSGRVTLATFAVIQKKAIALSGTTFTDTATGLIRELYVNRDQNQIGAEFEIVSPRLMNLFEPFFNIAVMKSKLRSDETMVVNKENPVVITSAGISLDNKSLDFNFFCKYVSQFENKRFAPTNAGPQPLGDFFVIDLNGGYTLRGRVPARIYLRVRNLTDKKYSTVVGYPDFGRMIYIGMRLNISKEGNVK